MKIMTSHCPGLNFVNESFHSRLVSKLYLMVIDHKDNFIRRKKDYLIKTTMYFNFNLLSVDQISLSFLFNCTPLFCFKCSIPLIANLLEHRSFCSQGRSITRKGIYYLTSTELISLTPRRSCEVCVGD